MGIRLLSVKFVRVKEYRDFVRVSFMTKQSFLKSKEGDSREA